MRRYDIRFGKLFTDTIGRTYLDKNNYMVHPSFHSTQIERYCMLCKHTPVINSYFFTEPVTSVNFSRDGHCILVSSLDNRLRLLDKDNGEMLNR